MSECQSCTMPIESGSLCEHCVDGDGALRPFEETLKRMVQWTMHNEPGIGEEEAEQRTRAFMKERPAWRDHPELEGGST